MATADGDEVSRSMQLVLQDAWNVISSMRTTQLASHSWLSDHQWKHFKQSCVQTMEKTKQERLTIGIVAPSHSGKSTMINALLGIALLPTDTATPSERFVTIHYTPRRKGSKLKLVEPNGRVSTGLESVRQQLQESLVESPSDDDWHMEPALELNAAFCKTLGSDTDSIAKLDLIEVPTLSSPNTSPLRRHKIKNYIDALDGVFFLIDATKLHTDQEPEIISELKEAFTANKLQVGSRLFFCITKAAISIDNDKKDDEHTEMQKHVMALLQEAGFQVTASQVFVMSSLHALLSRLVIADKNDPEVYNQFGQLIGSTSADATLDKSELKAKAAKLLELSGVPRFEEEVLGFLHQNHSALKLISILDDIIRTLQTVLDAAHTFKMSLSQNLNEMRHGVDRLKTQLENGSRQLITTKTELTHIEKDATIKVQEILTKLKNVLLRRIGTTLSCEIRDDRPSFELPCSWQNIRQDFLALIHHAEGDAKHAEELVKELHEEVVGQIRSEMEVAWMVIEDMTRDRHFERVLRINQDLDHLSKLLESIVVKDLNIQIEPAEIRLRQVNTISFQRDMAELLTSSIKKQTIRRSGVISYILGAEYSVYLFDGGWICEFFENIVRETIDDAIRGLQTSMRRHVSGQIASAEEKIRSVGESFTQGIEQAIEIRMQNINTSASSMEKVIEDITIVKKLKTIATQLRRRIETGMSVKESSSEDMPSLEINVARKKDLPPEENNDTAGRYIPPRSRIPSQDVATPRLTPNARVDSIPWSEVSDHQIESPKSAIVSRPSDGDNWRMGRSGSGTWSSWTGAQSPLRTRQPSMTSTREVTTPTQTPISGNFSPRSNFFRAFQQTPRATKGRGSEPPQRTGSWTG